MNDQKSNHPFIYLNALLTNSKENAVLLMRTDGTITAINNAFTINFGYSEEDIVGQNSAVLFTDEEQKLGQPKKELEQVQATGQANDNNYLVDKSKKAVWVSGESVLVKNETGDPVILKVIQNIHQQKSSEIALRELNNFNENILATIDDAVVVLDENMDVVKMNDAFLKLVNKDFDDDYPLNFGEFVKQFDKDNHLYKDLAEAMKLESGFTNMQIEIDIGEGKKKVFEVTATPLLNSERNLLIVIHDITIYKRLEKEREDIIGFVTHELRNPLSTLALSNEIMKDAIKENDVKMISQLVGRFENNVKRMNKIIADLYESIKVTAGHFILEMSEFNFGEMVQEAISSISILQSSFNIDITGNANFLIVADRSRLIQVIVNFLTNAIKYSNGNTEIALSISHDDHSVTVGVKDKGLGISKENLPYVFERFFRIKKTRKIEGIGLGLHLCKQIIRAHKGKIWAESEENKGSTFYFSIPIKPSLSIE